MSVEPRALPPSRRYFLGQRASFVCHPDEVSKASFTCHPDDLSNARGGRTSDSFAHAKPVPVSENRAAVRCSMRPGSRKFSLDAATKKPEPAALARRCPRSVPPVANAPVVRMTEGTRVARSVRMTEIAR